jgi:pyridoxine/pyridoxamine 5'-phosphate oxidase
MDKSVLHQFLSRHKLGVLGSIAPKGTAQAALVGIAVTPELEIIFDTVSSSRKFRNLSVNPRCSFVVGWSGETTVQFEGFAFQPRDAELARYQKIYFATWPDGRAHLAWAGITYFVVRPLWIRYSDYDQRPPFIEEFHFEGVYQRESLRAGK